MKDVATFVGNSGDVIAIIYEGDGFYKVNYGSVLKSDGKPGIPLMSQIFKTESEAEKFAAEYTNKGNSPVFLNE
jgi:hypothetical protein